MTRMPSMSRITAAAFALLATGTLTACGGSPTSADTGSSDLPLDFKSDVSYRDSWGTSHTVGQVEIDVDGRTVDCVTYDYDRGGGIDCDWASARPAEPAQ